MKLFATLPTAIGLLCNFALTLPATENRGIIDDIPNGVAGLPNPLPLPGNSKESAPNPIAPLYPNNVTGTLNGTLAVVPIPYQLARDIIPAQYRILKSSFESLLPNFPAGKYPLIVRILTDHDIRFGGLSGLISDFQSVHLTFPFVDLLGDDYSHFAYEKFLPITYTNDLAISGAIAYGEVPIPARFSPQDEAYAYVPAGAGVAPGTYFSNAFVPPTNSKATFASKFSPLSAIGPWPFSFYKNVTNQPVFSNGKACDQQVTLYNSSISIGSNAPVGVKGKLSISSTLLPQASVFKDIYGIKVDSAFIENNLLSCESLKGYAGP